MPQLGADFLQCGCGIARLGQREYLMLIRSQATNQRPADRTARTGDQNSHGASFQAAARSLVVDRGLDAVIGDDVGDQPCRFGLARIGTDGVVGVWPLGPGLAGAVDAEGLALDLGADGAQDDIREDEAGGGMGVTRRRAWVGMTLGRRWGLSPALGVSLGRGVFFGCPLRGWSRLARPTPQRGRTPPRRPRPSVLSRRVALEKNPWPTLFL